ncbi:MAG: RNA-binding domain-containing protein [Candidatus Methanodesulfokora washburnensis]|jgi:ATP-dependent DNA helicase RecG
MDKTEGETLEFKRSLSDFDEVLATVSAFSNTKGGTILIGVDDNGEIIGVDLGKRTLEEIASRIAQNTDPRVYPEIAVKKMGGKNIIEIRVSERSDKPVFAKGVAYKRIGRSNIKMDRDEILNLLRGTYELSYEDVEIASIDEIDLNKVKSFIHRAKEARSVSVPEDELAVLRNLGLIDEKARLAALLLFGRNPQSRVPWAIVKIGKFLSERAMPIFEKEIEGDLIEQIERSYAEVLSLIRKETRVVNLRREEILEYPAEALRELIVNAVSHRDYSIKSPVYIKIYDDKIIIENPGGLPPGITVDELKKPHRSVLRNPKIANVLYNLGYVEKWGVGTLEVMRKCLLNGNGEPIFQSNGFFKVEIKSRYLSAIDDRERTILEYIRKNGKVSRSDLERILKLRESSVRKILEKLQRRGLIVKEGGGKNTVYKLAY